MILSLLWLFISSVQASPFEKYPAKPEVITCKPLDYTSYFQAERGKTNLQKVNPDTSHPNFGGKYLILKNELFAETLWFIADCKTGKFFKEKLSGELEFKPDSLLAILRVKNDKSPPEYQTWTGEEWAQVEAPVESKESVDSKSTAELQKPVTQKAPQSSPLVTAFSQYDPLFSEYATPASSEACHELDFGSYFRAQSGKENIKSLNPDLSRPNFAGHFILLKNKLMFDTLWLIADCKTGQFLPFIIKGNANFKNNSTFVLLSNSGDFPKLMNWTGSAWVELVNLIQPNRQKISNAFEGKEAALFFDALPNPGKMKLLRFKSVECEDLCSVEIDGKKEILTAAQTLILLPLVKTWGTAIQRGSKKYKIDSGRCSREKEPTICEIDNVAVVAP